MATCIVCKAYLDSATTCDRCGSDNSLWKNWQKEPVEKGGIKGLLAFTRPHAHFPFVIILLSISWGLMAFLTLWHNIKPGLLALSLLGTPAACLLLLQLVYAERRRIRNYVKLRQVKKNVSSITDLRTLTIWLPLLSSLIVLALMFMLMRFDFIWELVKWFFLIHPPETGGSAPERLMAVLPFTLWVGYILLSISLAASSSLILASHYVDQLDEELPHPLFLQYSKLVEVVQREAEEELNHSVPGSSGPHFSLTGYVKLEGGTNPQNLRLPPPGTMPPSQTGTPSQVALWGQAAHWVWDELERTADGGIQMKMARDEIYKMPKLTENSGYQPYPRVSYIVHADPWGRITKIEREAEGTKK